MDTGVEEAKQDLAELEDTLQTVRELLQGDPENEEYLQMQKDACEGIEITKALIVGIARKKEHVQCFATEEQRAQGNTKTVQVGSDNAGNQTVVSEKQKDVPSSEEVATRVGQEEQGSRTERNVKEDTKTEKSADTSNVNTTSKIKKVKVGG